MRAQKMKTRIIFFSSLLFLLLWTNTPLVKAQNYPYDIDEAGPTPTPTFSSTQDTSPSPTPTPLLNEAAKEINTGPALNLLIIPLAGLLVVILRRKVFK
jgi:hypothetical protein